MRLSSPSGTLAPLFLAACVVLPAQDEVLSGLRDPQRLLLTPGGHFLVTEASREPRSGRVSVVTPSGGRHTLLDHLPSGASASGAASGPTAMALRRTTLFLAIGGGDAERPGPSPGTAMHNPTGASSPLFASILQIQFSAPVDLIRGTFRLSLQHEQALADGFEVLLAEETGATARISRLAALPISTPDLRTIYRFSHPLGIDVSPDGRFLFVADASQNTLTAIDALTGRWRNLVRFAQLPNPTPASPPEVDAVPTSVQVYAGSFVLVGYQTGPPFVPGLAGIAFVDPVRRTIAPFIQARSSIIDFAVRPRENGTPQIWVLEFSANQGAQPPAPGRLIRYDTAAPQVALDNLRGPVSLALNPQSNELFLVETGGRLLRYRIPQGSASGWP